MTTEQSNGKARTIMTRAKDLKAAETAEKPSDSRAAHGHFAAGNRSGVEARFRHVTNKVQGSKVLAGEAGIVARDSRRVSALTLKALPSDAPPVRAMVALYARHYSLNAFYTAKAEEAGLTTPEGLALLAIADAQSKRAERVLVTATDLARVCAERAPKENGIDALRARILSSTPKEGT